jgi:hypothetical protein
VECYFSRWQPPLLVVLLFLKMSYFIMFLFFKGAKRIRKRAADKRYLPEALLAV